MILSALFSIAVFVAVLFVLVIVHEWGHFFTARRFGVRVYEFGFGFPPKICKIFHKNGTDFTANWIPLGGFVRLKGEDGSDAHDADSFANKAMWKRLVILFAGVAMNFVLGFVIFFGLFAHGSEMATADAGAGAVFSNERIVIGAVIAGSPAARAGFLRGDEVAVINDISISHAEQVPQIVKAHAGQPLNITVRRSGSEKKMTATPVELQPGMVAIGLQVFDVAFVRYPVVAALKQAGRTTGEISQLIFKTLGTIVSKLVRHGQLEQGVSGPVGIAAVTGTVARAGWTPLLQLTAMLSINLGILNALPIPSLDGGRALFVVLEKITRRKMRADIERVAHIVGFVLLMALVIVVTYRDILGLIK